MKRGHARAKNSSGTWPASSLPPFSPRASQPQPQPLPYFSPRASQPQLYPPQPQPQASRALWRAPHWAPGQRPPQVHCGASASAVQDARAASHATRRSRSARSGSARPVRRAPPLSRVLKASSWPRRRPRPQLLGSCSGSPRTFGNGGQSGRSAEVLCSMLFLSHLAACGP